MYPQFLAVLFIGGLAHPVVIFMIILKFRTVLYLSSVCLLLGTASLKS